MPSLVFSCLALPAVALIVRRLARDDLPAAAVVVLTALSPIPVMYATFGRPHTLLFAWLMWATVVALAAADSGDRRLWIAAGALLGLTVFVHPTAPLYALTAFGAAWLYAPGSLREKVRVAWPGAVALLVTFVAVLRQDAARASDRYGVGGSGQSGRTFSGRPVWEDALHFVAPGRYDVNYFTVLAALGVVVLLARRSYRPLMFCVAPSLRPVVFFSVVPTSGDSALFFDRYMIPVTPAFLVLVCVGIFAIASWAGTLARARRRRARRRARRDRGPLRSRPPPGDASHRRRRSRRRGAARARGHGALRLDRARAARTSRRSTTGTRRTFSTISSPCAFRRSTRVDDEACANLEPFLQTTQRRYGLWLFYAASPEETAAAERALGTAPIRGHYFAVRSRTPLARARSCVKGCGCGSRGSRRCRSTAVSTSC